MNRERMIENLNRIDNAAIDAMIAHAKARSAKAFRMIRRPEARVGVIKSPIGELMVADSDRGLVGVHFLWISDGDEMIAKMRRRFELVENEPATKKIASELDRYFKRGDASALDDQKVDLSIVESEFQRHALMRLRAVPSGSVITYQGLAAAVGHPNSQRAIGTTMATNPIPLFVPCHRVIRSDGTVGNYGGGVDRKLLLLEREGFHVGPDLKMPSDAVLGHRGTHIFCRLDCKAAARADQTRMLIFADAEKAEHAGLRACKRCHPALG
jgi:methylated-DNA-[protein]-cysteine S-methyltransferase